MAEKGVKQVEGEVKNMWGVVQLTLSTSSGVIQGAAFEFLTFFIEWQSLWQSVTTPIDVAYGDERGETFVGN